MVYVEDYLLAHFTIILEPNYPEPGYTVRVPYLPGVVSYGKDKKEAVERAKEAVAGYIQTLQEAGQPVPEEVIEVELAKIEA
jgi:predicted RNase H-like HicB family nuclease